MAHLVESMAYVGDTPWHGLGNRLSAHQPLQTWLVEAGMDWHIAQRMCCLMSRRMVCIFGPIQMPRCCTA